MVHPSTAALLRHLVNDPVTGEFQISAKVPATDAQVLSKLYFTIVSLMHSLDSFVRCLPVNGDEFLRDQMAARIAGLLGKDDALACIKDD